MIKGSCLWSGFLVFFWNSLYGRMDNTNYQVKDVFQFACSSVGIQAPFLHATAFLMIYLLLISYYFEGNQINILYRMTRKCYARNMVVLNRWYSFIFIGVYAITYSFCLIWQVSFKILLASSFFSGLVFYSLYLITYYNFFGILFLIISLLMKGKWKSIIVSISMAVSILCMFYFTKIPTPFQGMDVFNNIQYQRSILPIHYIRNNVFNCILIYVCEYAMEIILGKSDVMSNEVL